MSYKIKTVSEMLGIPKNTLIAWERRFGFPQPMRLPNGYRVYSESDLAALGALKRLLDSGLRISEAMDQVRGTDLDGAGIRATAAPEVCLAFLRAALGFQRRSALDVLDTTNAMPMRLVLDDVFSPILHEVGRAWAAGEVSIAQEHFVSGLIRERMTAMFAQLDGGPDLGTHVACAGFPGEYHELGLLSVAIRLALGGCHVTYLGPAVPVGEVAQFAGSVRPAWVCVTLVQSWPVASVREYIHSLRADLPDTITLALGGPGLPSLNAQTGVVLSRTIDGLRPHGLI